MSSVQFRSRIKPAINYSNILNSYGYCCTPGQTPAVRKSYLECFNEGGYFIQSESNNPPACPDPETQLGCCCACSYVTQGQLSLIPAYPLNGQSPYLASGILSGVSRCECDRLRGNWTPGTCNPLTADNFESYCVSDNQDVRAPRSCCHMEFDETSGLPTNIKCTDVCTSYDCGLLSTSSYPSVFGGNNDETTEDTRCLVPLRPGGPYQTANCGTEITSGKNCANVTEIDRQGTGPFYYTFDFRELGEGGVIVKYDMFNDPDTMRIFYPGILNSESLEVIDETGGPVTGLGRLAFFYNPTLQDAGDGTSFKIFTIEVSTQEGLDKTFAFNIECPNPLFTEDNQFGESISNDIITQSSTVDTIIPKSSQSTNDDKIGSCFELKGSYRNYTYDCRVTRESDCSGYWVGAQGSTNQYCEIELKPANPVKVTGGGYDVQRMTTSNFNQFGLTAGDEFQGGIYIGIFQTPHFGKSSEVYGDITFTKPNLSRFESDGIGTKKDTQWALIVEKDLFYAPFLTVSENYKNSNTSLFDGYYNTYGDNQSFPGIQTALANTIKFTPRNGFIDYYLPSIYELNFYAAFLRRNDITNRLRQTLISSSIFNTKYMGSKRKVMNLYNTNFVYNLDINFSQGPFYKNVLTDVYSIQNVRFFRRIVLT